jgi:pimeloyl-ACP methyl ester carboxylesterase
LIEVRHVRRGSGEPYVLIHGIGSRAEVWAPVMDLLAERFEVIAVDLPGFGRSPAQIERPTVDRQADALAGWLRAEGLAGCHVAGNSMGAGIALELVRRGAVASAVALAPVGFWTPQERRWCQGSLRLATVQMRALSPLLPALVATAPGRALFGWQLYGRPWAVPAQELLDTAEAGLGAPAFAEALDLFDAYTFHDAEELAGSPVTVAWGSRDRLLLPRQAHRARRVLPAARHEWLQGAGHLPMWDAPGAVASVLAAGAAAA